jgi:peptide/nickel transport system substrate-binding protein
MRTSGSISSAIAALLLTTGAAGAETLRYGGTTPPLTMDPHATNDFVTAALVRQVYDSVVGLEDDMSLAPGIATDWEYLGESTWRFTIRDGVTFHDGSPLTAEDVAFSVMRQKESPLYRALFGTIEDARVENGNQVDVVTREPDAILPRKMVRLFVMSREWATENGVEDVPDLGAVATEAHSLRHANGSGPMRLVNHEPETRTEFAKNEEYWDDFPGDVTRAIYTPIGSAPTRVSALLSGELHLITDLPIQDTDRVANTPGFTVEQVPQQLFMQIEMDGTRDVALAVYDKAGAPLQANPFRDLRVRQAFAHAINPQQIVDRVMRGHASVVNGPQALGLAGFQEDIGEMASHDRDRARELLAEAGYPDGFNVTLNCPLERYVNTDEICRAVAGMLARVDVGVQVNGMVWPEFARMLVNGPDSSFHLIGASGNSGDLQDVFVSVLATRDAERGRGGTNWALWSNEEFDQVVDQLIEEFDEDKRQEHYRRGIEIAQENVHAIYLHQPLLSWGMQENVSVTPRADAAVLLHRVEIGE